MVAGSVECNLNWIHCFSPAVHSHLVRHGIVVFILVVELERLEILVRNLVLFL